MTVRLLPHSLSMTTKHNDTLNQMKDDRAAANITYTTANRFLSKLFVGLLSARAHAKRYKLKISCLIVLPSKKSIQKPKQPQRDSIPTPTIYFINRKITIWNSLKLLECFVRSSNFKHILTIH